MQNVPELRAAYAKSKLVGLTAASFLFVLIGVGMASGIIHDDHKDASFIQFMGYASIAFFSATGLAWGRRLFSGDGPVVSVTARGLHDQRLASDVIPWSAIRQIGVATMKGQKFIVLAIDPAAEARLSLTKTARWTRGVNRGMGIDGLCVVATGLTVTHSQLLDAIGNAWSAAANSHQPQDAFPGPGRMEPTL